jgi:serine/threonine-protein phosphatase 2A activator
VLHRLHRTWFAKVSAAAPELLQQHVLPERLRGAAAELAEYLADSLGNATRIDYGTGHAKLGVVNERDVQVPPTSQLMLLCNSVGTSSVR